MIYWELFWTFLQIGLFLVGGGYAAIPLIQSSIVDQHAWLTLSEFTDLISIAEMTPGPIAINAATFVGIRIGGIGGALAASFGCIVPSLVLVSLLYGLYARYRTMPFLQKILGTLRPVVVALILAAGLMLLQSALFHGASVSWSTLNWVSLGLFCGAFLLLRWRKWNPILVMTLCGALYLGLGAAFGW